MKRFTTIASASALALALTAGSASAGSGDVPSGNHVAAKQCQAEKQADRAAFEATYGAKRTMRECKRANREEGEETAQNAAQECRAEREADPDAFAETYGTNENGRNAFGKCVSSKVREEAEEDAERFDNAAAQCRAEREADPDAFAETYGTNANRRNAFGKCVSRTAREMEDEDDSATGAEENAS